MKVAHLNSAVGTKFYSVPQMQVLNFVSYASVDASGEPLVVIEDKETETKTPEKIGAKRRKAPKSWFKGFIDKFLWPAAGVILAFAAGALSLAFYGRRALIKLYLQQYNLPKESENIVKDILPGIFSSEELPSYVNEGIRALFNNSVEGIVMKNKEFLYRDLQRKVSKCNPV